jgi:hypothetical protein
MPYMETSPARLTSSCQGGELRLSPIRLHNSCESALIIHRPEAHLARSLSYRRGNLRAVIQITATGDGRNAVVTAGTMTLVFEITVPEL